MDRLGEDFDINFRLNQKDLQRLENQISIFTKCKFGRILASQDFTEIYPKLYKKEASFTLQIELLKQKFSVYRILQFLDFDGELIPDADANMVVLQLHS